MTITRAEELKFALLNKAARKKHKLKCRAIRQDNIALASEKDEIEKKFLGFYKYMHQSPKQFLGMTTQHHVEGIAKLVKKHHAKTLLDYGCGKGMQYLSLRLHEQWGGVLPHCYDPGVFGIHKKPRDRVTVDAPSHQMLFDGVICCDVMEHIPEILVPGIAAEIMSSAKKFAYVNIALSPAGKNLPNGKNVHVTLKSEDWWYNQFAPYVEEKDLVISFSSKEDNGD